MQNILVVSNVKSYLLTSIEARLREKFYNIIEVSTDMNIISMVKEPFCCILFFCDEMLMEAWQALQYFKDRTVEGNIPIVAVGNVVELESIKKIIPDEFVRVNVLRPITVNVYELTSNIDRILKEFSSHEKKKILVVDDSGEMLRTVKGWLEEQYDVFLVNSGAMMLKYLVLNRPDLILLDYEMPVCDGKQVLEMLRSETEYVDVPVIFLTGKDDEKSIRQVMALNPQGYLLKTLEPSQIIHEVEAFFNRQKALL